MIGSMVNLLYTSDLIHDELDHRTTVSCPQKNLFEYLNYDKNFPDIGQNGIKKQFTPKCFFGYPCFVIKKRD